MIWNDEKTHNRSIKFIPKSNQKKYIVVFSSLKSVNLKYLTISWLNFRKCIDYDFAANVNVFASNKFAAILYNFPAKYL